MKFPIFKTKTKGVTKKFNLADPKERAAYFQSKAGLEIAKLRKYLRRNTFIAYFLGKKNSGKGTYTKMLAEILAPEKISHFSIGDMIREVDEELRNKKRKRELYSFLERNYRGWLPFKRVFSALEKRSTKTLLPSELILALVKREIFRRKKKTLFIDGFPRDLDQVSYSLFFRDLIGYREDLDIFVLIDVPESVIDERIKWRRVCPRCQTSRNFKLLPTSKIDYDRRKKEFYLVCDNPSCPAYLSGRQGVRMIAKEGDELGIAPIKERLKLDEKLIRQAFSLYGIPKIFLRNSLPVKIAKKFVDDYEITPEYNYQWDKEENEVRIIEKPWIIRDDEGVPSYSLLAAPVTVSLIKQMADVLEL